MKSFIRGFFDTIFESRKANAEIEIAKQLWLTEFKHESFDYILTMVRAGKIYELNSEKRV